MRLRLGIGVHQNGLALDAMDSPCIARVGAVAAAVVSSSRVELHVVAEVAAAQQPRHQLQRAALPNAVVGESAVVLQLLARVHQALLVEGWALLVSDPVLDAVDGVCGLGLDGDCLACDGPDEELKEERVDGSVHFD